MRNWKREQEIMCCNLRPPIIFFPWTQIRCNTMICMLSSLSRKTKPLLKLLRSVVLLIWLSLMAVWYSRVAVKLSRMTNSEWVCRVVEKLLHIRTLFWCDRAILWHLWPFLELLVCVCFIHSHLLFLSLKHLQAWRHACEQIQYSRS